MFTVELRVNGIIVGHAYGVNKGPVEGSTWRKYKWHYYDTAKEILHKGTIQNDPSGGLELLVSDILSEVARVKNESEVKF